MYAAKIKAADPRSDLAILEIEADNLTPIKFGDASGLKKGQIVVALGNPYAIARDGQASASWGIISNLSRKAPPEQPSESNPTGKDKLYHFGTLIQTDAKLNLGTSGGALVNLHGEMIGLTTSLAATAGYEQAAGYAVPVDDTFRRVVDTLKQGREVEYGYLGVQLENLKDFEILHGARGARIAMVQQGSPADHFGLRQGDVVTQVNGQTVYDADSLMLQVGRLPVESNVQLTLKRDDREQKVQVELAKFPVRGVKVVTVLPPACAVCAWIMRRRCRPTPAASPSIASAPTAASSSRASRKTAPRPRRSFRSGCISRRFAGRQSTRRASSGPSSPAKRGKCRCACSPAARPTPPNSAPSNRRPAED